MLPLYCCSKTYVKHTRNKWSNPSKINVIVMQADDVFGQVDNHGRLLDDVGGPWGGAVVSLNSRGEYFRPRIMQYRFEN